MLALSGILSAWSPGASPLVVTLANGLPETVSAPVVLAPNQGPSLSDPLARASVADDIQWDTRFGNLTTPVVYALAIAPNGDVYVGGIFSPETTGLPARNIARWDGRKWSALGDGVDDMVSSIVVSGTQIIVSGAFLNAGGVPVSRIAAWDTRYDTWSPLGAGLGGGHAYALVAADGILYAGGTFDSAGGAPAANIAMWDGDSWSPLGGGVNNMVTALTWSDGKLYVGGYFDMAGGETARCLALWDGVSWSEFRGGADNAVTSIVVDPPRVYVAGLFSTIGPLTATVSANAVAMWNGAWTDIGGSVTSAGWMKSIEFGQDGLLYAAGTFTSLGSSSAPHVARWDGLTWAPVGGGVTQTVGAFDMYALAVRGMHVYVGGAFDRAGGIHAPNIAHWDAEQRSWSALGQGFTELGPSSPVLRALQSTGDGDVLAAGYFQEAGGVQVNSLARWSAARGAWQTVGGSAVGYGVLNALALNGADLYVGGYFTKAGGVNAVNIARWNATTGAWSALGSGTDGFVSAVAAGSGRVYVGGGFQHAGGVPAKNLAVWDGVTWNELGGGIIGYGPSVHAMELVGNDLFIGGQFGSFIDTLAMGIVRWDTLTQKFYDIGGVSGCFANGCQYSIVHALDADGGELFVGGDFTTTGSVLANGIAMWNGTSWSALGAGVNGPVYGLTVGRSELYVVGGFTTAGGLPANHVARWNRITRAWSPLGSGVTLDDRMSHPIVQAAALSGGSLYVAGDLVAAGGNQSWRFARWQLPQTSFALIAPSGGAVVSAIDNTSYAFAAGTFTGSVRMTHTAQLTGAPAAGSLVGIGHFYSVTAVLSTTGQAVQPMKPYTVTVAYEQTQLSGTLAARLALYYWDGAKWVKEPSSTVTLAARTVRATPNHFSMWAVLGTPAKYVRVPSVRMY